eukprot:9333371-Prorocentrum_lima.AAC.1
MGKQLYARASDRVCPMKGGGVQREKAHVRVGSVRHMIHSHCRVRSTSCCVARGRWRRWRQECL